MSQEGSSKRSRERNGQVKKSPSTKASSLETEALQLQQKKLEEDIELLNNRVRHQEGHIKTLKQIEEQLIGDAKKLREECKVLKREKVQVTTALEAEAAAANARAMALEEMNKKCEHTMVEQKEEYERDLKNLIEKYDGEIIALDRKIAELSRQVTNLEDFKRHKDELQAAAEKAKQDTIDLTQKYEIELGEVHLRAHRLEHEVERLHQEAAAQAAAAGAADEDEADLVKLLHQNRKLASELRKYGEKNAQLVKKIKEHGEDMRLVTAQVQVAKDLEQAAVRSSATKGQSVVSLQQTVAKLREDLIARQSAIKEYEAVQAGLKMQISALKSEVESRDKQLRGQAQELQRAQQTVKKVFEGRSEAQAFLVSSIRAVKRQIYIQRKEQCKTNCCTTGRKLPQRLPVSSSSSTPSSSPACFPPPSSPSSPPSSSSSSSSSSSALPPTPSSSLPPSCGASTKSPISTTTTTKTSSSLAAAASSISQRLASEPGGRLVDVGDLTWEEREAVLRLLLASINNTLISCLRSPQNLHDPDDE